MVSIVFIRRAFKKGGGEIKASADISKGDPASYSKASGASRSVRLMHIKCGNVDRVTIEKGKTTRRLRSEAPGGHKWAEVEVSALKKG